MFRVSVIKLFTNFWYNSTCLELTILGEVLVNIATPSIRHLELKKCNRISSMHFTQVIKKTASLEYLDISNCIQLDDTALSTVGRCHKLESLLAESCFLAGSQLMSSIKVVLFLITLIALEL